MAPVSSGAIASRVMLRDCLNRLRTIRQKCGKVDEDGPLLESTGDPFKDRMINFQRAAKQLGTQISERNTSVQKKLGTGADMADDSHQINVGFKELREQIRGIEDMIKESAAKYAKHAKQKGHEDKMALYEKQEKERRSGLEACRGALEQLYQLNQQRNQTKKEIEKSTALQAADKKLRERTQLRESLAHRMKRSQKQGESGAAAESDDPQSTKLEDDPETKELMKQLEAKKQRENDALTAIGKQLDNITNMAVQIGAELDAQEKALLEAEEKADKATFDLKMINKGLTKLMKDSKPMNVFINIACGGLLLGIVGYLLYDFGAV